MSSLNSQDRASLCLFTFTDGRRCRTPRIASHPHFCFYHARKESKARAAEKLGHELSYFFSGDFVTACDLSTALGRLIPAVARGDIKPKTAATLAFLARTFLQALRLSRDEFIAALGETEWRKTVCDSINQNFDHLNSAAHEHTDSQAHLQAQPSAAAPATPRRPTPGHGAATIDGAPSGSAPAPSAEPAVNPAAHTTHSDSHGAQPNAPDAPVSAPPPTVSSRQKSTPQTPLKSTPTQPLVTVDSK
ncbi:MAG: hypothetical protein WBE13_19900 [Candidatus Acidiferrum sp.]